MSKGRIRKIVRDEIKRQKEIEEARKYCSCHDKYSSPAYCRLHGGGVDRALEDDRINELGRKYSAGDLR